jgi:hypothetical protein
MQTSQVSFDNARANTSTPANAVPAPTLMNTIPPPQSPPPPANTIPPSQPPPPLTKWDGIHTLLLRETTSTSEKSSDTSLADACKKLDINLGTRHEDYCFDGAGLARWANNTTDIDMETGEVFGGDDITGQM